MSNKNKNVLNKNDDKFIHVNGRRVLLDVLNDKEIGVLHKYASNPAVCCNKPFKTRKSLDGDPSFKGYKANKFF